eukprot:7344687-Ditylum_brightwellii.AAC.1
MALEIPELGEQTGGQQLPAVRHQTLATSSSRCGRLTYQEGQEGDRSNSDIQEGVSVFRHEDELGQGKWRNEILGL